jgi:hypothetical protein
MNSIKIATRTKTNLTVQLEKKYDVTYYVKPTFLKKLLFVKTDYPDIYFHKGSLSVESVTLIENAKIVIVNAINVKKAIVKKLRHLDAEKIHLMYPYYHTKVEFDKEIKKEFKRKYTIDKKSKIIFICGKDLQKSGLMVLFDLISRMYKENFTILIESSSKQIAPLRLQMERSVPTFNYILFEDYQNMEELFIASDIFILPTQQKYFSTDILRAMYYRNAVFLMEENHASEIIDTFSLIQSAEDRSVSFKVDSLLINNEELKKIQKENQKIAKTHSLENSVNNISNIITTFFDI